MTPTPIHPLDLGLLLLLDPDMGDVVIRPEGIEYKGSLYTQTVEEPLHKTELRVEVLTDYLVMAKTQLIGRVR